MHRSRVQWAIFVFTVATVSMVSFTSTSWRRDRGFAPYTLALPDTRWRPPPRPYVMAPEQHHEVGLAHIGGMHSDAPPTTRVVVFLKPRCVANGISLTP